jgi:hypothetical protein
MAGVAHQVSMGPAFTGGIRRHGRPAAANASCCRPCDACWQRPLRDQQVAVADDALQRTAGRAAAHRAYLAAVIFPIRSSTAALCDARQVTRVFLVSRLGTKQIGVFLPGVVRAAVRQGGDVEFKSLQPLLVEGKVDRAGN